MGTARLFAASAFVLGGAVSPAQTPGGPKPRQVVAIVAGQTIYDEDLAPLVEPQLRQIRQQEYERKSRILEGLVNKRLVEVEAQKKGIPAERLEVKAPLGQSLRQARRQEARQSYFTRLRQNAEVTILLRPPKVDVGYDPTRVRGRPDAPIAIVEFSDFQCPFCARAQAAIQEVLTKYDGRVKLT